MIQLRNVKEKIKQKREDFLCLWAWEKKGERLGGEGREFENLKVCFRKEEREGMDFGARQKTIEFGSAVELSKY